MYAVIKTGGKQYKVSPGDVIQVEHLKIKGDDAEISLTPLLVVTDRGETVVGARQLSEIPVSAKVLGDAKGDKVTVFKYRPKSGYASKTGHRQLYSLIQITAIGGSEAQELKTAEDVQPKSTGPQKPSPVEKKEPSAEIPEGQTAPGPEAASAEFGGGDEEAGRPAANATAEEAAEPEATVIDDGAAGPTSAADGADVQQSASGATEQAPAGDATAGTDDDTSSS